MAGLLESIALSINYKTRYHVSFTIQEGNESGVGSGIYLIRPWVNKENISQIKQEISSSLPSKPSKDKINITSISKI